MRLRQISKNIPNKFPKMSATHHLMQLYYVHRCFIRPYTPPKSTPYNHQCTTVPQPLMCERASELHPNRLLTVCGS